jgi:hypothetical protein
MPKHVTTTSQSNQDAYANAQAKYQELQAKLASAVREYDIVCASRVPRNNGLSAEEVATLRELGVQCEAGVGREQLRQAEQQVLVLRRALEIQKGVLDSERRRATHAIATAKRPAHQALAKRIAAALSQVRELLVEESSLRDELFMADAMYSHIIRPMPLRGTIYNDQEALDLIDGYIREVREYCAA